jgi:hypothetical protein
VQVHLGGDSRKLSFREVKVVTPLAKKDFVVMGKREEENMGTLG